MDKTKQHEDMRTVLLNQYKNKDKTVLKISKMKDIRRYF